MYFAITLPVFVALLPLAVAAPAPQDTNGPTSEPPRATPATTATPPIATGPTCGEYWPVAVRSNVAVAKLPIMAGYADNEDQSLRTCQNLVPRQPGDAAPTPLPSNLQDLTLGSNLMYGFFVKPECTHCKVYSKPDCLGDVKILPDGDLVKTEEFHNVGTRESPNWTLVYKDHMSFRC